MERNYGSQQIREKGFFVTDYNTKLKKLLKEDNRGKQSLWPMYQTKLLKDFNKCIYLIHCLLLIHINLVSAVGRIVNAGTV